MKDNEMDLLLRSFDEELDAGDRGKLASLLEASGEARTENDRIGRLRSLVADSRIELFAPQFADRVMAGLSERGREVTRTDRHATTRIERRNRPAKRISERPRARRPGSWRVAGGFAVAALVVVAAGIALWLQPRTVTVPYGAMETVTLPDGSVAELGSGSTLTYRNFRGRAQRRVTLEGEAFFDVAEAERPFIVETFNASISVLGTRFNVRAWSSDPIPETLVALESGRVEVAPRHTRDARAARTPEDAAPSESTAASADETKTRESAANEAEMRESAADEMATRESAAAAPRPAALRVVLEPGQVTSVVRDSAAVRPPKFIALNHIVAWRSGGLAFVDQPVGSVFRTIERRFDVDVRVADPSIQNRLLTYLNPNPSSPDDVLSDICHTLDLRYRQTANGFEILSRLD